MSSLNAPTQTHLEQANSVIGQIRTRIRGKVQVPYSWHEYEADISRMLEAFLPHCVLRSVRLFTPSFLSSESDFGLEVDNMLHIRHLETDYLVLVESKGQPVRADGSKWLVSYTNGVGDQQEDKDVRNQVENHLVALHEYLYPVSRSVSLKVLYFVASNESRRPIAEATGYRNATLVLLGYDQLVSELASRLGLNPLANEITGYPLRIAQSEFLDLLRLGHAHPHLGHPEISSAIRFVERCRRELDQGLFTKLKPTEECWLINGSAGMGKSVLLAYAAAVISCGHELYKFQGETGIKVAEEVLKKTKCHEARLVIAANSQKQLDSLQFWFNRFVEDFQEVAQGKHLLFRRPKFLLFDELGTLLIDGIPWSAVFLDEAHDLRDNAAHKLKQASDKLGFYLVAACDRHQRIMDSGADSKVIRGFNFSGKFVRLSKVYRNPAPIYIASLGLMFRWFAKSGPKVIPTASDLKTNFDFNTQKIAGQPMILTLKSDAHPANSWSHSVARFKNAATVATILRRERLRRDEVLWVRFCKEERTFDYESLHRDFTYHNCRTSESVDLNDKYIKGQEYPIVVIEGFQDHMDRHVDDPTHKDTAKNMWKFRRELYLCASRATCFLFFIYNDSSCDEYERIDRELDSLLYAVSSPKQNHNGGTGVRSWSFCLDTKDCEPIAPRDYGDIVRNEDDYPDVYIKDSEQLVSHTANPINLVVPNHDPLIETPPWTKEAKLRIAKEGLESSEITNPESSITPTPKINKPASRAEDKGNCKPKTAIPDSPSRETKENSEQEFSRLSEPILAPANISAHSEANNGLAESFPNWPIPEDQTPAYEFVIVVDQPASVSDFAHTLGIDMPVLLKSLRKRGLNFATNTQIPLAILRSLAFEFGCYPAATEAAYEELREESSIIMKTATPVTKDKEISIRDLAQSELEQSEEPSPSEVKISEPIFISDLSRALGLKPYNVISDLVTLHVYPDSHRPLSANVARQVCNMHKRRLVLY